MTERTPHSLSEKIINYDSLVEENERLKGELENKDEEIYQILDFIHKDHEVDDGFGGKTYEKIEYVDQQFYWEGDQEGDCPMEISDIKEMMSKTKINETKMY